MEIKRGPGNKWVPSTSFKRYWNRNLWKEIFETLLNIDEVTGVVISSNTLNLRGLRKKIDDYINADAKILHSLLSRQANILPDSREKIL